MSETDEDIIDDDFDPTPPYRPRPTLWQRIESLEALLGVVFALILTCVVGLASLACLAQWVYLDGRRGSYQNLAGGVALLVIFVMQFRYALGFVEYIEGRDGTLTPAVIVARIRRGSIFQRLIVAIWAAALAVALLLFAHTWAGLFQMRGSTAGTWIASAIGGAILFVGAFASNAAIISSLAALGVGIRFLDWLWNHRYLFDTIVAVAGTILADQWTEIGGSRILP